MTGLARALKLAALRGARATGLNAVVANSRWRRQRLLVLCYHGVAMQDEHEWSPELYVSQEHFRARMRMIRDGGYQVLRLDDAVRRLQAGTLPRRAVAITVDDGAFDFAARALPVLEEFGFPVTLYLTTHYCGLPYPVWSTAARYLLWKGRHRGTFDAGGLTESGGVLRVSTEAERHAAWQQLRRQLAERSTRDKNAALATLAGRLGIDYERLRAERLLQLMTPEEVRALPRHLVDVELHTHRHRTPRDETAFEREIADNRSVLERVAGHRGTHFCYTSGHYHPSMFPWLRRLGVVSATTCVPGLATGRTEPLELPRLVDNQLVPDEVFEAWLSGVAAAFPNGASTRPPRSRSAGSPVPPVRPPDLSSSIPS